MLFRDLNVKRNTKYVLILLMGLGGITGGIAIARVATAPEIKAYDGSWKTVPNTMTKIFEVNIGNVAACVPLFKPFGKYVRAKVTGQDTRELFYRKSSNDSSPWYSRNLWTRRSKSRSQSDAIDLSGPTPERLPTGVVRMKAINNHDRSSLPPGVFAKRSTHDDTTNSSRHSRNSLGLPLQGTRMERDIPPVPDIRVHQTRRDLHGDYGEMFDVKDIV